MATGETHRSGMQEFSYPTARVTVPQSDVQVDVAQAQQISKMKMPKPKRRRKFNQMCCLAVALFILSICAIIVGTLAMVETSEFPYIINSPSIAGVMGILFASLMFCLVQVGRKIPDVEEISKGVVCIHRCSAVAMSFAWIFVLVGLGFGGIWAMIECQRKIDGSTSSLNFCDGDAKKLYMLSVIVLVIMSILTIVMLILSCCLCSDRVGYRAPSDEFKKEQKVGASEMQNLYPDESPPPRSRDHSERGHGPPRDPQQRQYSRDRPRDRPRPNNSGSAGRHHGPRHEHEPPSRGHGHNRERRPPDNTPIRVEYSNKHDDKPPSYKETLDHNVDDHRPTKPTAPTLEVKDN